MSLKSCGEKYSYGKVSEDLIKKIWTTLHDSHDNYKHLHHLHILEK